MSQDHICTEIIQDTKFNSQWGIFMILEGHIAVTWTSMVVEAIDIHLLDRDGIVISLRAFTNLELR